MTDHPLTDKICEGLVTFPLESEHDYIEMRATADWQLKQVVEFIKKEDTVYAEYIYKAMRPQGDNND